VSSLLTARRTYR